MIYKIMNLVNNPKCYNYLNLTIPILYEKNDNLFYHNKKRLEHYNPSSKTFEGLMCCGGTSYLLSYYLKQNNINTKLVKSSFGYGKYLEDHCFLLYNDNIIIDPTFKQFFTTDYDNNGNNNYYNYLYCNLPFVFVGNYDTFNILHNNLRDLYFHKFNRTLDSKLFFWKAYKDISYKLDLHDVVNNKEYAKNKGKMFEGLYIYLNQ